MSRQEPIGTFQDQYYAHDHARSLKLTGYECECGEAGVHVVNS